MARGAPRSSAAVGAREFIELSKLVEVDLSYAVKWRAGWHADAICSQARSGRNQASHEWHVLAVVDALELVFLDRTWIQDDEFGRHD
jgi:hypothetical protein